jgi:hypothetical protein
VQHHPPGGPGAGGEAGGIHLGGGAQTAVGMAQRHQPQVHPRRKAGDRGGLDDLRATRRRLGEMRAARHRRHAAAGFARAHHDAGDRPARLFGGEQAHQHQGRIGAGGGENGRCQIGDAEMADDTFGDSGGGGAQGGGWLGDGGGEHAAAAGFGGGEAGGGDAGGGAGGEADQPLARAGRAAVAVQPARRIDAEPAVAAGGEQMFERPGERPERGEAGGLGRGERRGLRLLQRREPVPEAIEGRAIGQRAGEGRLQPRHAAALHRREQGGGARGEQPGERRRQRCLRPQEGEFEAVAERHPALGVARRQDQDARPRHQEGQRAVRALRRRAAGERDIGGEGSDAGMGEKRVQSVGVAARQCIHGSVLRHEQRPVRA